LRRREDNAIFKICQRSLTYPFVNFSIEPIKQNKMKKLVVLTGAGISAESGISTFRDSGGLWDQYPVEDVATPEGFVRNPKLVLDFYAERRRQLLQAEPNEGHFGLARLQQHFDVRIITQNIDNLHERAGSKNVLHLHGELTKVCSTYDPNYIVELSSEAPYIRIGDKCPRGGQLRPFIVWFGEAVPAIEAAAELSSQADIYAVIGTSLNVYPAAGLLNYVPRGVPVYLIDPKEVHAASSHNITFIQQPATVGVVELEERLLSDLNV
jgi:NAD-dependent deacetylase